MVMLPVLRWSDAKPTGRVRCLARTMPRAPNRAAKKFKFITKTIHFAHLGVLFIYYWSPLDFDNNKNKYNLTIFQ